VHAKPVEIHLPEKKNRLIELLPRLDRQRFLGMAEPVTLRSEQVLWEQGGAAPHVYFPTAAFISLIASLEGNPALEVGMAGFEGMLGAQLALGATKAPLHAVVQGEGTAWRLGAAAFRRELLRSKPLKKSIDRYLSVLFSQVTTSAACVRFHQIRPRLARWLLMTHDRARADTFYVTHEFLSYMLGVRRVGITTAASGLQEQGLIFYRRGHVAVLDRPGLERASCSCYAADCTVYSELLN
jgi:CRP-like cAMP-binding protein